MLFLFSEILLLEPLCQFDNLFAEFLQLAGFFGQFIKESKRFLLPVNGMDGLLHIGCSCFQYGGTVDRKRLAGHNIPVLPYQSSLP